MLKLKMLFSVVGKNGQKTTVYRINSHPGEWPEAEQKIIDKTIEQLRQEFSDITLLQKAEISDYEPFRFYIKFISDSPRDGFVSPVIVDEVIGSPPSKAGEKFREFVSDKLEDLNKHGKWTIEQKDFRLANVSMDDDIITDPFYST